MEAQVQLSLDICLERARSGEGDQGAYIRNRSQKAVCVVWSKEEEAAPMLMFVCNLQLGPTSGFWNTSQLFPRQAIQ